MQIFLVGTAHVSKASSEEVRGMLRAVKPQTVFVELDIGRARQLVHGQEQKGSLKARLVPACHSSTNYVLALPVPVVTAV